MAEKKPVKATLLIFEDDFIKVGHIINSLSINDRNNFMKEDFRQALNFATLSNIPQNSKILCDTPEVIAFFGKGAICEYIRIIVGKRGVTDTIKKRLSRLGQQIIMNYESMPPFQGEAVAAASLAISSICAAVQFRDVMVQHNASVSILILPAKKNNSAVVDVFFSKSGNRAKYTIVTAQDFESDGISCHDAIVTGLCHCLLDCATRYWKENGRHYFVDVISKAPLSLFPTPEVRFIEAEIAKRDRDDEEIKAATILAKNICGNIYHLTSGKTFSRRDAPCATTNA